MNTTTIDLQSFCSKTVPYLDHPFSKGAFTYATDRFMLIRVPLRPECPEQDKPTKEKLDAVADFDAPVSQWEKLPVIPEPVPCEFCRDGRCYCPCCGEEDCGKCDGSGHAKASVKIGERTIDARFLRKIATLPNVEIAPEGLKDTAMLFRFDGGVGCVMPIMRVNE